ncbi:MAG: hypothetical protein ABIG61_01460 [Planctomycetota bacterium]
MMNWEVKTGLILLCLFAVSAFADTVGPPIAPLENGTSIELTAASPSWSADVSTAYANWRSELYVIEGYYSGGVQDPGVKWSNDGGYGVPSYAVTGGAGIGAVMTYKFTCPEGYMFDGGTVDANCLFYGNPELQGAPAFFGVGTYFEYNTWGITQACANDFDKAQFLEGGWLPDPPYTYHEDFSLAVPSGVSEFYVAFSSDYGDGASGSTSGTFGYSSLDVNAIIVAGEPNEPPDPGPDTVGPPVDRLSDGNTIVLSTANSSYSADLSTYAKFRGDAYAIIGYTWPQVQIVGLRWSREGLYGMYDAVGLGWGGAGTNASVIYRFEAEAGYQFSGGTVSMTGQFYGNPSTQGAPVWFGVGPTLKLQDDSFTVENYQDFTKQQITTGGWYPDPPYCWPLNWSLDVPNGVSEFYVVFADNMGASDTSAVLIYDSLDVNAAFTQDFACGEPGTLYFAGDLNRDCYIDINDVALFVEDWLSCTDPNDPECIPVVSSAASRKMAETPQTIVVDANLNDWTGAVEWILADQVPTSRGTAVDVNQAYGAKFAVRWDDVTGKIYAAVIVEDTDHKLGTAEDVGGDHIEVFSQGDAEGGRSWGVGGTEEYDVAQHYVVWMDQSETVHARWGGGWPETIDPCVGFEYAAKIDGDLLIYEVGVVPFDNYGGISYEETVITHLDINDVVGFDIQVHSSYGSGAAGEYCWLLEHPVRYNYRDAWFFGQYVIVEDLSCGDVGFATGDICQDCDADFKDFAEFGLQWMQCTDPNVGDCDQYWK